MMACTPHCGVDSNECDRPFVSSLHRQLPLLTPSVRRRVAAVMTAATVHHDDQWRGCGVTPPNHLPPMTEQFHSIDTFVDCCNTVG